MSADWTPVAPGQQLPDEGATVEVITPGGEQRPLVYAKGLWWLPDQTMYVYFTPRFWRAAQ